MSGPVSNLSPAVRMNFGDPRFVIIIVGLLALALLPWFASQVDNTFLVSFVAKMMIFAIAAATLDLILGYGGMVSFGHAAYIGLGAYAVAVSAKYFGDICGVLDEGEACAWAFLSSGWFQFPVAFFGSALVAFIIGLLSLRTSGIYFIMITLAFTQVLLFLGIGLEEFGGDDGITVDRSDFGFFHLRDSVFEPRDGGAIYYFALVLMILSVFALRRIVSSRFGMVIRGAYSNPVRMRAIGFPVYRYRLTAFVIAGAICGLAGALFTNHQEFLTPEYMLWIRSGEIMIMVIMGGMGTIFGPVFGALGFLATEEVLQGIVGRDYWYLVFGPLLIVLVLFAKRGLFGLIPDTWSEMPKFLIGALISIFAFAVFVAHLQVFTPLWIILSWIFIILVAKMLYELLRVPASIVMLVTGTLLILSNAIAWATIGIKPGWSWVLGGDSVFWAILLIAIVAAGTAWLYVRSSDRRPGHIGAGAPAELEA